MQNKMCIRALREILLLHGHSIKTGIQSTTFASNTLIHLYAKQSLVDDAQKLFEEMPVRNVFSWNTIIAAHVQNKRISQAESFFTSSPKRDVVTYNSLLSGYVNSDGYESNALKLFDEMRRSGSVIGIDEFTATTMLNLVVKLGAKNLGMQLHSSMVKSGTDLSRFSVSSLVDMYSKCGCFREAYRVFDCVGKRDLDELDLVSKNTITAACCREGELELGLKIFWSRPELNDTVSWNTMISGLEQNGCYYDALRLFVTMVDSGVRLNEYTITSVLSACSGLPSLKHGKEVHAHVLKHGFNVNPYISSGIVDLYCKCGKIEYAESANAELGMNNAFAVTSMIVGHASVGDMIKAREFFDLLKQRNSVATTALFSGYVKSQQSEAVFKLFKELLAEVVFDAPVLVSVIGACAIQASLNPGKQIHCYLLRKAIKLDEKLMSAMVDMYSKCGNIKYAERSFQVVVKRDSVLYNVMIAGYAHHGEEEKAVALFSEMLERGLKPDAATFIALLSACRHAGLVELGERYFYSMSKNYNIPPENNHYACMIDLYGRAKHLDKAVAFMKKVPIESDAIVWGAFLNACKMNSKTDLAAQAEEKLLTIDGDSGSRYVQLANVYAVDGNWPEMVRIRKKMRGKEVRKLAGCSWVYIGSETNIFTSGDSSHHKSEEIYFTLACLTAVIDRIALVESSRIIY